MPFFLPALIQKRLFSETHFVIFVTSEAIVSWRVV